jgi:hypothetical protein
LADEYGVSPLLIQSLIAGGVGIVGIRKLLSLGSKIKTALPALMGAKTIGEIPASVLGEFAGETVTKTGAVAGRFSKFLKIPGLGAISAVATTVEMVNEINEFAKETRIRRGKEQPVVPLPKAFSDLRTLKRIGAIKTTEEELQFLEKEGIPGIREERAFLPLGNNVNLKNMPSLYNMSDTLSSTLTYSSAVKSNDIMKKAKEEGEKESVLNVIFSTDGGANLGETMVKAGETAFININLGAVVNGLRG